MKFATLNMLNPYQFDNTLAISIPAAADQPLLADSCWSSDTSQEILNGWEKNKFITGVYQAVRNSPVNLTSSV